MEIKNLLNKDTKGFKSTLIAIFAAFLILTCLILTAFGTITGTELTDLITGITAASVVILGLLSKDKDKTGTDVIKK